MKAIGLIYPQITEHIVLIIVCIKITSNGIAL